MPVSGRLLHGGAQLVAVHRPQLEVVVLQPVGKRPIGQRLPHEVGAQRQAEGERRRRLVSRQGQQCIDKAALARQIIAKRVQFLKLVGDKQDAGGAGASEDAGEDVGQNHCALFQGGG